MLVCLRDDKYPSILKKFKEWFINDRNSCYSQGMVKKGNTSLKDLTGSFLNL